MPWTGIDFDKHQQGHYTVNKVLFQFFMVVPIFRFVSMQRERFPICFKGQRDLAPRGQGGLGNFGL